MQPASPRVVELLNEALTFELTVTNTYFLHARMLDNWGLSKLGKVFYDLSIDEMRDADDLFRLPVDRVFTRHGTGTVVTGTVWSGGIARDQTVTVMPGNRAVRVRGLQAHGAPIDRAHAGMRLAVALAGIDHDALARGAVLVADSGWHPTRVLRADVSLLANTAASLSPRATVRFHLGTTEVGARIVTAGGPLTAGETKAARVVLDTEIVARAGDRFVLRGGSPMGTLGGGVVVDPHPTHRRARPWSADHHSAASRLGLALREAGAEGLDVAQLAVRIGASPSEVAVQLNESGADLLRIGGRIFDARVRDLVRSELTRLVDDHHARHSLNFGAALQTVRAQLSGRPELIDEAIQAMTEQGVIEVESGVIRRAGWTPRLTASQEALKTRLLEALRSAGPEPPGMGELEAQYGPDVSDLIRILDREGLVVPVEPDRYYEAGSLGALVERLRGGLAPGREYSPSELRDVIGLSRKFLIPFLEYCDRRGITERRPGGRVLHGTQVA